MKPTTKLRELLALTGIITLPGAYDCIGARFIESEGFPAAYMTGAGTAAARTGRPDVGLITMSEMVDNARRMARAVDIPMIVDADTGYGNVLNVMRTVEEFEAAGVAAIQIEDQVFPKKCGQLPTDTAVEPIDEQCRKIEALAKAKLNSDFFLIARTDAKSMHGLDDAAYRGRRYLEAGADAVLVIGADRADELERVAEVVRGPLMTVLHEHPPSGDLDDAFLRSVGCVIAIHSGVLRYAVVKKLREVLATMRQDGSTRALRHEMCNLAEYNKVLSLDDWQSLEL